MRGNYVRPPLYPKQEEAFFNDKRISATEASTKSGKTVGCIAWLFEQAILNGKPNRNYWWVAPVSSQADIAYRRMKEAIPNELYKPNETEKFIKLVNGSYIRFKSAEREDTLYGEDVYAAVVDEASRVSQDAWHAVRTTVTATKGPIRLIGNVKGRANWFYKLCRNAEEREDMHYAHINAYDAVDAGVLDLEEVESAKRMYPEPVFRELYLAEPGDDQGNPFGIEAIDSCILRNEDGEKTTQPADGPPICWGWDVAKGMNYTVGIALNKNGEVCEFHRWMDNWDATIARIIALTKGTRALVDSTGAGDPIDEMLQKRGGNNFRGFKFSRQSKQDLMVALAVAIQTRGVRYPDSELVNELEKFEYEISPSGNVLYSAPKGVHDDCVDALAMAWYLYKQIGDTTIDVPPIEMTRDAPWTIS